MKATFFNNLSGTLFFLIAMLSVVAELGSLPVLRVPAVWLLAMFLLLQIPLVSTPQKVAGTILVLLGFVIAWQEKALFSVLFNGLERTLPFLLIFASVGWLQTAARQSPSILALRDHVLGLGPGRRFAALSASAHVLASSFNLAGMALLVPILDDQNDDQSKKRLACSIMWGFTAATCWSPFFVGTAVVLDVLPMVVWADIMLIGMAFAGIILIVAWLFDRTFVRSGVTSRPVGSVKTELSVKRAVIGVVTAAGSLFCVAIILVDYVGLRLPVAVAVAAPSFSLVWMCLTNTRSGMGNVLTGLLSDANGIICRYPHMRSETFLFVCANVFGAAMSILIADTDVFPDVGSYLPQSTFLAGVVLIIGYLIVSALGIHPIVSLTVFAALSSPETLNISPDFLAVILMALWGIGTAISPLSGTTLFMGHAVHVPSSRIAWRWNGPYYMCCTLLLFVGLMFVL
ncbi:hypothetical protein [Thalassospira lucentensis]|uniref:hypothetical protein n=1 Tax=Thalassospira lucentensis TaxID=168935 RepID=UPI003D2DF2B4|tara:strand:- start:59880 stop:61253 length:1374 start_codon:yes stop_codon:yes gene_type:complete